MPCRLHPGSVQHLCLVQSHPEPLLTHHGLLSRSLPAWHHHVRCQCSDRQRIGLPHRSAQNRSCTRPHPVYLVNISKTFLLVLFFLFPPLSPRVPGQPVGRPKLLSRSVPYSDTKSCLKLRRPVDHLPDFSSPQSPGGRFCCPFQHRPRAVTIVSSPAGFGILRMTPGVF
jgi:hypothetical protein